MKYTKENVVGLEFKKGSSHYIVKLIDNELRLYSQPPLFNNPCGSYLNENDIIRNFNINGYIPINFKEKNMHYEIY